MNREIKFRAWDGAMRYSEWYGLAQFFHMCREDELMQYTSLKDKKGRDIYEGDILTRGLGMSWKVYFCKNEGSFKAKPCDGEEGVFYGDEFKHLQVIGNIFENKELIEKIKR